MQAINALGLSEICFINAFFEEKNLAFAPKQQWFSSDRRLKYLQAMMATVLVSLCSWLYWDANILQHQSKNLVEKLQTFTPTKRQQ